ncbi:hypothetical protein [Enterococcus sp. LJL51]|uniref:hypothetical protein n=1 Tax=Enterococcus sp. LJL51 TaxID=3416656 RepID=UPI003CEA31F7
MKEKLEKIQEKYRGFLIKKFQVYRCWQSYDYFVEHYKYLYDRMSDFYMEYFLSYKKIMLTDTDIEKIFSQLLEKLVRICEKKMNRDFEKQVIITDEIVTEK